MRVLTNSLLSSHRLAVTTSVEVVTKVGADDLGRPTPCSAWTLADLLAHMTAQHRGFAAAAAGRGADPAVWRVQPPGADPVADYVVAADQVLAAFAVAEQEFVLPELGATFPATQAVAFHLIDYVVHGWDVARALDLPYELHPDLAEPALRIATRVPDGPARLEPGAAFRPGLPAADDATPLDRILSALGRAPGWPA
jgi:uncharacterized protein (TIGR03086 family)